MVKKGLIFLICCSFFSTLFGAYYVTPPDENIPNSVYHSIDGSFSNIVGRSAGTGDSPFESAGQAGFNIYNPANFYVTDSFFQYVDPIAVYREEIVGLPTDEATEYINNLPQETADQITEQAFTDFYNGVHPDPQHPSNWGAWEDPSSDDTNQTTDTPDTNTTSPTGDGQFDSDDDVPMLTNIYDRLYGLQEATAGTAKVWDWNGSDFVNEQDLGSATLAQIQQDLSKIREIQESSAAEMDTTDLQNQQDSLSSDLADFQEQMTRDLAWNIDLPTISGDYANLGDINMPDAIHKLVPIGSFNLLDATSIIPDTQLPPLKRMLTWIKLIIGAVAIWTYARAMFRFMMKHLDLLVLAQESNPVTTINHAGFSFVSLGISAAKFSILGAYLTSLIISFSVLGAETVTIRGESGGLFGGLFSTLLDQIFGEDTWTQNAWMIFNDFFPLVTVTTLLSQYFGLVVYTKMAYFATNRIARLLS